MKKQKFDEAQFWLILMTVLPVVILMNLGNELSESGGQHALYAGVFGGLGGLLGFATNYFTKDKSRFIKIMATVIIVVICGTIFTIISDGL